MAKMARNLNADEILFLRNNKDYFPAGDYSFIFLKMDLDHNVLAYFVIENGETSHAFHSLNDAIKHRDTIYAKNS